MTPTHPVPQSPIIHNYSPENKPPVPHRPFSDPNHLAPEDAFYAHSPPRKHQQPLQHFSRLDGDATTAHIPNLRGGGSSKTSAKGHRSRSQKGPREWQKLLWVKQRHYPDNYTDPTTFLKSLQRNPRLRPYEFWTLVAESTVIVQHVSSVAIFVCSFVGIYHDRVSPVSVGVWAGASSIVGWLVWDSWVGQAEALETASKSAKPGDRKANGEVMNGSALNSPISTTAPTPSTHSNESTAIGLGLTLTTSNLSSRKAHRYSQSQTSLSSIGLSPTLSNQPSYNAFASYPAATLYNTPRWHERFATAKSAILITLALLGLSPILKSLTESTTSDSIWAMTTWLMGINIFFFDYSGGVGGVKFPASLSTNAALMASTVLASRLDGTTHVFSLTLLSIEVFGLFPVFRRHLRHISWRGHVIMTFALMFGAGAGLGLAISDKTFLRGGWKRAFAGAVIWVMGSTVVMGGCSWWLIHLQRYKNVVIGPWDPARPVLRGGGWE